MKKDILNLCKRRGFVFPASEIYNGINGIWDFGPLGTQIKNNIRDAWWQRMVVCPPLSEKGAPLSLLGLDSAIIQNPKVWQASGHVAHFSDPLVDCKKCKMRLRADKLDDGKCTHCGSDDLTESRPFNMMLKTYIGATAGEDDIAYLRPETAQGEYINYKNVRDTYNLKPPFGIAQIGKAFRNEINPRHFLFRVREFEQMEMQFFCPPEEAEGWFEFWLAERQKFWRELGLSQNNMGLYEQKDHERTHYARRAVDIEYAYYFCEAGKTDELEGIHNRGTYDLTNHQNASGKKMTYTDPVSGRTYIPAVIETAAGLTRSVLAFLTEGYTVDENRPSGMFLKLPYQIAPFKMAVLPLMEKDGLLETAVKLYGDLNAFGYTSLDTKQSIGKRYARHDEIGTPFCITVDYQSKEDQTVTIRDRDTMRQDRIAMDKIIPYLQSKI
ncbi:MAG: glycine--tRNA ligase [Lactobacillales bacterium]|jgi:glycyl-tRNA synthetase|nr:glycine--tRNA ligase [Lactobacillales bacterium]